MPANGRRYLIRLLKVKAKRILHRVRSSASSLNFLTISFISHMLPLSPVTSILPSTFPSVTCFRRQMIRNMWPMKRDALPFPVCRIFLFSFTLCNNFFISHMIGQTDLHPSPAPHFKTLQAVMIHIPKSPNFSTTQSYSLNVELY